MATLPTPPFSVLIVSEQESIGRESSEVSFTIKQLAQAGVEIFEYVHGKSLTPKSALDKVLSVVQGFGDEAHREATAERVHQAHTRLAKAGHVTGFDLTLGLQALQRLGNPKPRVARPSTTGGGWSAWTAGSWR